MLLATPAATSDWLIQCRVLSGKAVSVEACAAGRGNIGGWLEGPFGADSVRIVARALWWDYCMVLLLDAAVEFPPFFKFSEMAKRKHFSKPPQSPSAFPREEPEQRQKVIRKWQKNIQCRTLIPMLETRT